MNSASLSEDLLEALSLFTESGAPLTTSEIAETLGCGPQRAADRLERLVDRGRLDTKTVGEDERIWWQSPTATRWQDSNQHRNDPLSDDPRVLLSQLRDNVSGVIYECRNESGWPMSFVSDGCLELTGYDATTIETGRIGWGRDIIHPDDRTSVREAVDTQLRRDDQFTVQYRIQTVDDEIRWVFERGCLVSAEDREDQLLEGVVIDITDQIQAKQELSEYRTTLQEQAQRLEHERDELEHERDELEHERDELEHELAEIFDRVDDPFCAFDDEFRFDYVNEQAEMVFGQSETELLGRRVWDAVDIERDDSLGETFETAMETQEVMRFDRYSDSRAVWELVEVYPSESGLSVYFTDITERKERKQELQNRIQQQEAVTELSHRALEDHSLDELIADAVDLVATTLDTDYCKLLDFNTETDELLLREGVGWEAGIVGSATVSAVEADSQAAYTLQTKEPVVVEDLSTDSRFHGPELLINHGVQSGLSVIIGTPTEPWGILGAHDTASRQFTEHDANFIQSVANILASAIDRHQYEQRLIRQRENVEALNNLHTVAREITNAVIEQSTREEIEATVCRRLAATDSYCLAWIGEVDTASQRVDVRTKAGKTQYVDDITISVDPNDQQGRGPLGRAFQTGTTQVANRIETDPLFESWRDHAASYGICSVIAIPIVHEGITYGILNVYADRHNAFEQYEREVIAELGEIIGHAIAATERKRALLSTELIELDVCIPDVSTAFDETIEIDGTTTFDHVVPIVDNEFLVYGTATQDAIETIDELIAVLPHWESVTYQMDSDPVKFELTMSDPPILSRIASYGGYIDSAEISDGEYRMTIHLSPSTDVSHVADLIRETYPEIKLLRRQQITIELDSLQRTQRRLTNRLTDRQQTVLETAYHSGFFEWPRENSGEEIAETLDVAPATFHQHIRKAEKQLFGDLLSTSVQQRK